MSRHTAIEDAPELRPRSVYFQGPDGALRCTIIRPASPSRVAHYQFTPDGSRCLRRVLSADGAEVLSKEFIDLGDHPRCSCGKPEHAALAAEKLAALRQTVERRLPPEALYDLERELRSRPGPQADTGEYDGGYLPGGIGWFDDDGQPADGNDRMPWGVDAPRNGRRTDTGSAPARFLADLAAADSGGQAEVLAPIVERVLFRTITHPPRLAGGWDDLFQEGMATALRETAKLAQQPGERLDRYAARLERRVALAVKHRLIDLVRRQDAATRNMPASSLEAGQEAGIDVPASDTDPFDLLFRLPDQRERRARFRAIALAVYREARGLARQIIRRAYLGTIAGRSTRGTLELRDHPEYPAASRWLADAWTRAMAQAMQGALQPAYHRHRKRLAAPAA
jgi:hypothetical protein